MRRAPSRLVLLGHPVRHSLSPLFQNAALRHARIPASYEAVDVSPADLPATLAVLARERAAGTITVPHKAAAAALCARVTPLAKRVGAVNTFWLEADGALVGDNTDVGGARHLIEGLLGGAPDAVRFGILGAGGGAAAVLAAVEGWARCEARVFSRTAARAVALCERFRGIAEPATELAALVDESAVLVNATPIGLERDECPIPPTRLRADAAVVDLVYRRGETYWVRAARACGLRATDGLPMLVEQGALAFERWFDIPAPRAIMRAALG